MILIEVMAPYFVGVVILFILMRIILREADSNVRAEELPDGVLRFAPVKQALIAMMVFIGIFVLVAVASTISTLIGGHGLIVSLFCLAVVFLLLQVLPGTVLLTKEGLEQHFWLGNLKKIAWSEVRAVSVLQREGRVVIFGASGKKIQYTRQLPDRDRLLAELRLHCPDKMPEPSTSPATGQRQWTVPPPPPKA